MFKGPTRIVDRGFYTLRTARFRQKKCQISVGVRSHEMLLLQQL